MKKNNIKILAFAMTLCVSTTLSACATNIVDTQEANKVTSNSLISEEQAYDSSDTSSSNLTAEAQKMMKRFPRRNRLKMKKPAGMKLQNSIPLMNPTA